MGWILCQGEIGVDAETWQKHRDRYHRTGLIVFLFLFPCEKPEITRFI